MNKNTLKENKSQKLYLLTNKAIPTVLINVLKVKDLIENENLSVANATKKIGISRSTYYKYCDEVFYYNSAPSTKTIDLDIKLKDKVGTLSNITNIISNNKFNILTINQTEPIDKVTKVTISIIMTNTTCNLSKLVEELKNAPNMIDVSIKSIKRNNFE